MYYIRLLPKPVPLLMQRMHQRVVPNHNLQVMVCVYLPNHHRCTLYTPRQCPSRTSHINTPVSILSLRECPSPAPSSTESAGGWAAEMTATNATAATAAVVKRVVRTSRAILFLARMAGRTGKPAGCAVAGEGARCASKGGKRVRPYRMCACM